MSKRLPLIAIVGRPNVGKSALFNRIVNQKIAIVDEAEGITRDRLYARAELFGRPFEVVDTGGIDAKSEALFNEQIREQALIAIEEADALIMVVDAKIGVTKLDNDVAQILLKTKKPLALAVNKVDSEHQDNLLAPFYSLGIEAVIGVSAVQGRHLAEILESVVYKLPEPEEIQDEGRIQVAFIGRPNVGKSTLTNALLGEERCIVSPIAGTTRDSIDIKFSYDGQDYTLIDTAGVRRKNSEKEVVDKFAAIRTKRAIERADVCVLLLDSQEGMTAQEKTIANMIEEAGKGCIMVFNKWDLVKGFRMEHCMKAIRDEVPFMAYCPGLFISALSGRNIDQILPLVKEVYEQCTRRVSTGELNRFFIEAMQLTPAPRIDGKRLRIYYAAQVATGPARFILFINHPDLMMESYERYLMNRFREKFGFKGAPVIFSRRGRAETDREHKKRPSLAAPAHHHHHHHASHEDEVFAED